MAGLGKGLRGDHAQQPGALPEQGEEVVELGLHGRGHAREQEDEHGGEGQRVAAGEKARSEATGFEKFLRIQEVGQPVHDAYIFRPSWKSPNRTMRYGRIVARRGGIGQSLTKC